MDPCKQAGSLGVISQSRGWDYPRGRVNNVLSSVTDLFKGLLGTPTKDTRSLRETEGDRRIGKMLLINHL